MTKLTTLILMGFLAALISTNLLASDNEYQHSSNKLYGTVEQLPDGLYGTWIVDGQPVQVTRQTKIEEEYGRVKVGAFVEIEGTTEGPNFRAYELEVKRAGYRSNRTGSNNDRYRDDDRSSGYSEGENEFYGTITQIPQGGLGTWIIGNREIFVDQSTRLENEYGQPQVGSKVEVKGFFQNGTFHARKIETKN